MLSRLVSQLELSCFNFGIMWLKGLLLGLGLVSAASAQLADTTDYPIGPLTSSSAKWAVKVCDITDYGAVADGATDAGPAILAAFNACSSGGVVNIPLGTFAMATWVTLNGGSAWAINLEGIIVRTGTAGGNMIYIEHSTDFEIYSSRGEGAIQGYGYQFHEQGEYGPRLLRLYDGESQYCFVAAGWAKLTVSSDQLCYPRYCAC